MSIVVATDSIEEMSTPSIRIDQISKLGPGEERMHHAGPCGQLAPPSRRSPYLSATT